MEKYDEALQTGKVSFPAFIKPKDGGSGIDAYKVDNIKDLKLYAEKIGDYGGKTGGAPLSIKAGADNARAAIRMLNGETLACELKAAKDGAVYSRFNQSVCVSGGTV